MTEDSENCLPSLFLKKGLDSTNHTRYSIHTMKTYQTIEQSSRGATYHNNITWTVYEHSTYPRSSVLSGQTCRAWLDEFDSEAAALAAYPKATVSGNTYRATYLNHLTNQNSDDVDWLG
jgi:hypothetical protein